MNKLFRAGNIANGETNPNRNLFAAVLARAICDLDAKQDNEERQKHAKDAELWVQGVNAERDTVSFELCCEVIDLDPEKTRKQIIKKYVANTRTSSYASQETFN